MGSERIRRVREWKEVQEALAGPGVLVFKHSTRCPISARAYRELERFAATSSVPILLIWVVEDRPLSNRFAEVLGVPHASPQAIYVRAGKVVWTDSHHRITAERLREVVGTPTEAAGKAGRSADSGGGRSGEEARSAT